MCGLFQLEKPMLMEALVIDAIRDLTPQQFHARLEAARRAYFSGRTAQGARAQRVSHQDHAFIVQSIFQSVSEGANPGVKKLLATYGNEQYRSPQWAERVSAQKHPKKMSKTLLAYKQHPVLQELKLAGMLTQTHKSALQNSTYSGFAGLLLSWSQNVRSMLATQQQLDEARKELAVVRAEAARANARLDFKEKGQDWREAARAIRAVEPTIKNTELSRRVGVTEASIRKYIVCSSNRAFNLASS